METKRLFVPFGELQPDGKQFNNQGLTEALNVVPVYGNYIASQFWDHTGSSPVDEPYGLLTHFGGGSTWNSYLGSITKLYEYNMVTYGATDKSRTVGGPYATSSPGGEFGWQGASFGDAVIMTNYVDDPQLLTSPAAANFVKLAQSGGANPGMDPKAKFGFPLLGNFFLANLNLAVPFDGLPAGPNPTIVAWSQSENCRQYGSYNATPSLIGTGYQPLSYDLGHITGGIGGVGFGLIAMQAGWVRVDGPPYQFRPTVVGSGCRFPNSIGRFDSDIYFWGASGPAVLRDGEGPPIVLGKDRVARTLIDNAITGFSPTYSISSAVLPRHVGIAIDTTNGLVYWTFTSTGAEAGRLGDLSVIYSTRDDRFSFTENADSHQLFKPGILFLQSGPDLGGQWAPGRDLVGVMRFMDEFGTVFYQIARIDYGDLPATRPIKLTQAYMQLDADATTRPRRVRPILSRSALVGDLSMTVVLSSKNRPYDPSLTTSATRQDSHGWVPLPGAKFADFHKFGFVIDGTNLETIVEIEGFEVEYELGAAYSA